MHISFIFSNNIMRKIHINNDDNYATPPDFYQKLHDKYNFDFDPCPYAENEIIVDGLSIDWGKSNFVNPPYRDWQKWVKKGYEEYQKGKLVVFLIKAATDTKAFHNIILPFADEIRFIEGRLHFDEHENPAPFPSMVVIFK